MGIIENVGLTTIALFGSFGWQELLIILVIVLLIFGPRNLPKLGRIFGKSVKEFRGAATKMSESMDDEDDEEPHRRERLAEEKRKAAPAPEKKKKEASS